MLSITPTRKRGHALFLSTPRFSDETLKFPKIGGFFVGLYKDQKVFLVLDLDIFQN